MKEKDLPQDGSALTKMTREVYYVKDKDGNYVKKLSNGWEVKNEALDETWEEIDRQLRDARLEVKEGRKSPIYFFMIKHLMEINILAAYVGINKFFVKRHMKPSVFKKLSDKKLTKYAEVFEITMEELRDFDPEESQK